MQKHFNRLVNTGLFLIGLVSCHGRHTRLEQVPASHSGIRFDNRIEESDTLNPLNTVNIYNGGGVGIGDFNRDGLPDIFFAGNQVSSRLYLNRGGFQFEDITAKAGVDGMGRWARGVSVVDINNDGWPDIYICNTIYKDPARRRNILYVNLGTDKDGIPHFKDSAAEYGLDVHVQSTMASFFDYDNDGDLDMYLTVNEAGAGPGKNMAAPDPNRGRLFRNDCDPVLGHAVFHDVSDEAGINGHGFGHAATICDINGDGWKDIYVSDDFISNNILYINHHDGTFTDRTKDYFKHTSMNSMGQDVVDINNDGLPDVIELDMSPHDNFRKKTMSTSDNLYTYQQFDRLGAEYQYVRNTLQLNRGPRVGENDSLGIPAFSEIGFLSGISQTDWSWAPLVGDFDNDGYRDLIVTNGFPRDLSNLDFIAYSSRHKGRVSRGELLEHMPRVKLQKFAYRNKGDLSFGDVTDEWGLQDRAFSSGAAYADFDNDGALDMVVSNIGDAATLYRNTSRDRDTASTHYLELRYKGPLRNGNGLGAVATIYYDHGKKQVYENNPYRGYLSSMEGITHFGLGRTRLVDSLVVRWPGGRRQRLVKVRADQVLTVDIADGSDGGSGSRRDEASGVGALFRAITHTAGIHYRDSSHEFEDFNIQPLLPHKFTEYSPALAAGDVDGNGTDDLVIGGSDGLPARLLLQGADGRWAERGLGLKEGTGKVKDGGLRPGVAKAKSDGLWPGVMTEGALLFDANGDGKPDLYLARGGYTLPAGHADYEDRLYINDGKGYFRLDSEALPPLHTSKFCVRATDYNGDGKLDLFVSGRVDPWNYPRPVSSHIFRNDSEHGHAKFTEVTDLVAPALKNIGMVSDALFTDFDGDGQVDLIVVGEWMPVTFLRNDHGKYVDVTKSTGVGGRTGWWNSIVASDFRHTGRIDYIVGNLGTNAFYQANEQEPFSITAGDFTGGGKYFGISSMFMPDRDGERKEFPLPGRDELANVMPVLKQRYPDYQSYALATMEDILTPEQRREALRLSANTLKSCFLRNDGAGRFSLIPLPAEAQLSMIDGMVADDFDGDGNLDVLINGNDYGMTMAVGRLDAMNGLLLRGDGKGGFIPLTIKESGIYLPGDGKALVKLRGVSGAGPAYLIAASGHNEDLQIFRRKADLFCLPVGPCDASALIRYRNGQVRKEEFYYGSSFLSQSSRWLDLAGEVDSVIITDYKGNRRVAKVAGLGLSSKYPRPAPYASMIYTLISHRSTLPR